jgi:CRP-like cAMP-binding protein
MLEQQLKAEPIFQRLSPRHLALIETLSKKESLPAGTIILKEGEVSLEFYLLLKGDVEIVKTSLEGLEHRIRILKPGELIGELAFIEETARSATVRTLTETEVLRIDGSIIKNDSRYIELYAALAVAMGKSISERLRYTNTVTVKSMQAELTAEKMRVAMGHSMVSIILTNIICAFSLGITASLANYLPSTTPISIVLITIYVLVIFRAIQLGGYPLSQYGLTLRTWRASSLQAMIYSLPILALVVGIKWLFILYVPAYHNDAIFQPFLELSGTSSTGYWMYIVMPLAYALFCPVQEFLARGAIQTSFQLFLGSEKNSKNLQAIILSNLIFAQSHLWLSVNFAIMVFFSGLFWGWMYNKQKDLVGVSVSHILIGCWVAFAIGFRTLF